MKLRLDQPACRLLFKNHAHAPLFSESVQIDFKFEFDQKGSSIVKQLLRYGVRQICLKPDTLIIYSTKSNGIGIGQTDSTMLYKE